jgi:PKD domain/Right handed beta helix region
LLHRRQLAVAAAIAAAATALGSGTASASAHTNSANVSAHGVAAPHSATPANPPMSAFKTFTSHSAGAVAHAPKTVEPAAPGITIYVGNAYNGCPGDTGDGSQANPYCSIQDAVNAAKSGDTISVAGGVNENDKADQVLYSGGITVKTSNLTIESSGLPWLEGTGNSFGPLITIDDATNVKISGLVLYSTSYTGDVDIVGSSNVTFDSDYILGSVGNLPGLVSVDGGSKNVTISRDSILGQGQAADVVGVSVAAGASNVVVASNLISTAYGAAVSATGATGLDVVGNTIQRTCGGAVTVAGTSTKVSIENNVFEDANPVTDQYLSGFQSSCAANSLTWQPDVTVGSGSTAGTTTDYNDFYSYGSDDTAPYSWGGATYPSVSAFQTAVSQGSHDSTDSVEASELLLVQFYSYFIDALPNTGSAAIGSANTNAPGSLNSDFYDESGYTDRGAIEHGDDWLQADLSVTQVSALGIMVSDQGSARIGDIYTVAYNWGDGTAAPSTDDTAWHTYSKPGVYQVSLTITEPDGASVNTSKLVPTLGNDYSAYGPARLLDTRTGIGAPTAPVAPNTVLRLPIAGITGPDGVIPSDVTAVVLNITVTNTHGSGFITAYDDGDSAGVPTASNVNYTAGQTVPNLTIVPVGADGDVALFNGGTLAGNVDLVADITGYFAPDSASGFTSLSPDRLVDTRTGTGAAKEQVGQNGTIQVQVAGADSGNLPTGISAVALNVTVTNTQGTGFLTVYPDQQSLPNASNVNYTAGQTIANSVIAPVAADGMIDITNSGTLAKGTDIIVDVVGYYSDNSTSAYVPVYPDRYLDTRASYWQYGRLQNASYDYIGFGLNPDENYDNDPSITGVVLNATVTNTAGAGILTVSPDPNYWEAYQDGSYNWPTPPNSSSLNWTKGETVPNLVQASTGQNGIVDFWNLGAAGGPTDLIVDLYGYYQNH